MVTPYDGLLHAELVPEHQLMLIVLRGKPDIHIWDIKQERFIDALPCKTPGLLLYRQGQVYNANPRKKTISQYDLATRELVNEFLHPCHRMVGMTAPRGEAFQGRLFLTGTSTLGVLNLENEAFRGINVKRPDGRSMLHITPDGKHAAIQTNPEMKPALYFFPSEQLASTVKMPLFPNKPTSHLRRSGDTGYLRQLGNTDWWLTDDEVVMPHRMGSFHTTMLGARLFADQSGQWFFTFQDVWLYMLAPPPQLTPFQARQVFLPEGLPARELVNPKRRGESRPPPFSQALQIDQTLHLFPVASQDGKPASHTLLHAAIPVPLLPEPTLKTEGFHPLPIPFAVSHFTAAEDGSKLYIACEVPNQILVWDIAGKKLDRVFSVPSPRMVLQRGHRLFVLQRFEKSILVLDVKTGELLSRRECELEPYYFSAPLGEHFRDELVVCCRHPDTHMREIYLMHAGRNTMQKYMSQDRISRHTVSANGRFVVTQADHPPGQPDFYPASYQTGDYQKRTAAKPVLQLEEYAQLYQVADEAYWYADNRIFYQMPPTPLGRSRGYLVAPDIQRPLLYQVSASNLIVRARGGDWPELSRFPLQLLPERRQKIAMHGSLGVFLGTLPDSPPRALVVNRELHLYHREPHTGRLMYGIWNDQSMRRELAAKRDNPRRKAYLLGDPIAFPVTGSPTQGVFHVLTGPEGARISEQGVVQWTPTDEQIGRADFKIRAEVNGEVQFHRFALQIHPPRDDMAWLQQPAIPHTEIAGKFLSGDPVRLQQVSDTRMLIQDGEHFSWRDASGTNEIRSLDLQHPVSHAYATETHLVAAHGQSCWVYDLEKSDAPLHKISLPVGVRSLQRLGDSGQGLVTLNWPLTGHATRDGYRPIYLLGEKEGTLTPIEGWSGDRAHVSADGKLVSFFLEVLLSEHSKPLYRSPPLSLRSVMYVLVNGRFDQESNLHLLDIDQHPADEEMKVIYSPHNKSVLLVHARGFNRGVPGGLKGKKVALVSSLDFSTVHKSWDTKGDHVSACFHPMYNFIAVTHQGKIAFVDRETFQAVTNGNQTLETTANIQTGQFSPDGTTFLYITESKTGGRHLHELPMDLKSIRSQCMPIPPYELPDAFGEGQGNFGQGSVKPPALTEAALKEMQKARTPELAPERISKLCQHATVRVKTLERTGSGFFITSNGYLLTCFHALVPGRAPTIVYTDANGKTHEQKGLVVWSSYKRDMALVAVPPGGKIEPLPLASSRALKMGETSYVIGHPGLGEKVLEYTMTEGILSSVDRTINRDKRIQTTAAVNPGSSGAPLLDNRGNAIGMIAEKANIEGAGFAIPSDALLAFVLEAAEALKKTTTKIP